MIKFVRCKTHLIQTYELRITYYVIISQTNILYSDVHANRTTASGIHAFICMRLQTQQTCIPSHQCDIISGFKSTMNPGSEKTKRLQGYKYKLSTPVFL